MKDDPRRHDADAEPEELPIPHPGSAGRNIGLARRVESGQPEENQSDRDRNQLPVDGRGPHGPGASTAESVAAWAAAESASSSTAWGRLSPGVTDSSWS